MRACVRARVGKGRAHPESLLSGKRENMSSECHHCFLLVALAWSSAIYPKTLVCTRLVHFRSQTKVLLLLLLLDNFPSSSYSGLRGCRVLGLVLELIKTQRYGCLLASSTSPRSREGGGAGEEDQPQTCHPDGWGSCADDAGPRGFPLHSSLGAVFSRG